MHLYCTSLLTLSWDASCLAAWTASWSATWRCALSLETPRMRLLSAAVVPCTWVSGAGLRQGTVVQQGHSCALWYNSFQGTSDCLLSG